MPLFCCWSLIISRLKHYKEERGTFKGATSATVGKYEVQGLNFVPRRYSALPCHFSVSSFPFPISYFLVPPFRATPSIVIAQYARDQEVASARDQALARVSPCRMDHGEHIPGICLVFEER